MKVFELSGKDDQLKLKFKSLEYCFDYKIKSRSVFILVAVDTLDILHFDLPCKTSPIRWFQGSPDGPGVRI